MNKLEQVELQELMAQESFRKFVLWILVESGFFNSGDRTEERNQHFLGRRSLGLDLLSRIEEAQPIVGKQGLPIFSLLALLEDSANEAIGDINAHNTKQNNTDEDDVSDGYRRN